MCLYLFGTFTTTVHCTLLITSVRQEGVDDGAVFGGTHTAVLHVERLGRVGAGVPDLHLVVELGAAVGALSGTPAAGLEAEDAVDVDRTTGGVLVHADTVGAQRGRLALSETHGVHVPPHPGGQGGALVVGRLVDLPRALAEAVAVQDVSGVAVAHPMGRGGAGDREVQQDHQQHHNPSTVHPKTHRPQCRMSTEHFTQRILGATRDPHNTRSLGFLLARASARAHRS